MVALGTNGTNTTTRDATGKNAGATDNNMGFIRDIGFNANNLATDCLYLVETQQMQIDQCNFGYAINDDIYALADPTSGNDFGSIGLKVRNCLFGVYGRSAENHIECVDPHDLTIESNEFQNALKRNIYLRGGGGNKFRIINNSLEGINESAQTAQGVSPHTHSIHTEVGHGWIVGNAFEDVVSTDCRLIYAGNTGGLDLTIASNLFGLGGAGDYIIEIGNGTQEAIITGNYYQGANTADVLIGTGCEDIYVHGELNGMDPHVSSGTATEPSIEGMSRLYPKGFKKLAVNMKYPTVNPAADLDVNGQAFTNGVSTFVKAGIPVDGDFTFYESGMIAVDSTNNRLYVRVGSTWKYTGLT
jgi:hypothetical protein